MRGDRLDELIAAALSAVGTGDEDAWIPRVDEAISSHKDEPRLWQLRGLMCRAAEDLASAVQAFSRAAALAPSDKKIMLGLARCRLEAGLSAVDDFEKVRRLDPADLDVVIGWIAAVAAERGVREALETLRPIVAHNPLWTAGHWQFSSLLKVAAIGEPCDQLIGETVGNNPGELSLWVHWITTLMRSRDYERALSVVGRALEHHPSQQQLHWLQAACLTETLRLQEASSRYSELGPVPSIEHAVFEARHLLRAGRADILVERTRSLQNFSSLDALIPYFSLAWRLTNDQARFAWCEHEKLVGIYDLADRFPCLPELAALLRSLHNQSEQPLDQSVRNGTQTDGSLLLRTEPLLARLRELLRAAVHEHLSQLPLPDPDHPQLSYPRSKPVRFAGSWSVRLQSSGFHDQHIHPAGWFSSAFYVSLPGAMGGPESREGWLTLGQPQDTLLLNLMPRLYVEPKPGRLVLFPSTMWHGTLPFADGERLTVAFDVAKPCQRDSSARTLVSAST